MSSVVDKIVTQANIEEKHSKAVQNKLKEMSVIYVEDNHTIAFLLLSLLLRDARSKASDILYQGIYNHNPVGLYCSNGTQVFPCIL